MRRYRFSTLAVLVAGLMVIGCATLVCTVPATVSEAYRLTGPYTHDNLAIYLIHREGSDKGPVPLTLEEALEQGFVKVTETGDIEELTVRNLGEREVFIQAGDIVKGGLQDRVLTVSLIVPPNSGDVPIGAFCVEHGRWSGRGGEKTTEFSASTARLPSRAGREVLAFRALREVESTGAAERPARPDRGRQRPEYESLQGQVWNLINEAQVTLYSAVRGSVVDERSPSSLQLSLENTSLAEALEAYGATLGGLPQEHPGVVGYVFAINGQISSGDEFGNAGLFRKLWPRQWKAASTEALAEGDTPVRDQPTLAEVAAFLDDARAAEPVGRSMPGRMRLELRESEEALYTEIRRQDGRWVHRSFVAHP